MSGFGRKPPSFKSEQNTRQADRVFLISWLEFGPATDHFKVQDYLSSVQSGLADVVIPTTDGSKGWDGKQIAGRTFRLHRNHENGLTGYNYQGSAVKGSTKSVWLNAYCGSSLATEAAITAGQMMKNGIDPNTIFAQTNTFSTITSTNTKAGVQPPDEWVETQKPVRGWITELIQDARK